MSFYLVECPKNEYFNPRGSACPPNTNNLTPEFPGAKPVAASYCNKGFIRGAISKICVPLKSMTVRLRLFSTYNIYKL